MAIMPILPNLCVCDNPDNKITLCFIEPPGFYVIFGIAGINPNHNRCIQSTSYWSYRLDGMLFMEY